MILTIYNIDLCEKFYAYSNQQNALQSKSITSSCSVDKRKVQENIKYDTI